MPVTVLVAMILAFGLRLPTETSPLPPGMLRDCLAEAAIAVLAVGLSAMTFGLVVAMLSTRGILTRAALRRLLLVGSRVLLVTALVVFAWILISLDWPRIVAWGLGLRNVVLVEQAALILPFLVTQVLIWSGLYPAEKAMLRLASDRRFGSYLLLKCRQSFAMIIPMAILYGVGRQFTNSDLGAWFSHPVWPVVGSLLLGAVIFIASPAFVRLSWPTRRFPDGPLRTRLERLARRLNFRYTDILLWDTGGMVVNAGVTGAIPWYRYVLITDAMAEVLDDREIEAVFGHEVGHIAHGHLPYFAMFCVGSMGLMTLVFEGFSRATGLEAWIDGSLSDPRVGEAVMAALQLAALGTYFYLVFGHLSRQFERQADVFGSRAVSCDRDICAFDHDPNGPDASRTIPAKTCSGGVHLFADALSQVAEINGASVTAPSWRHGSIARRVAFLRELAESPQGEVRFQKEIRRLRWFLFTLLGLASLGAFWLMIQDVSSP